MRPQVLAALATVLMIVLMAPSVQADEPSGFTEPGNEYRVLQVDEPGKIVLDLSVNDGMVELILLNETNWQRYEDDDPDYEALHRSTHTSTDNPTLNLRLDVEPDTYHLIFIVSGNPIDWEYSLSFESSGGFEIDLLPLLGLAGAVVIIVAAALLIKRKRK